MKHSFLILSALLLSSLIPIHAADASRPNILFALADDWGAHGGAYGTKWVKTPSFDRVAREGILFTHAYTPSAKCAPSRACILTGRNPWQIKEAANHICYFPLEFKTWGEALTEHGWFVGYTQKGWAPGVALDANGKPRLMTGIAFNEHKAKPPTPDISNNDYAANFSAFLDAAPAGKPWCFWYGSVEPHRGYEYGSGVAKGGKKLTDIDRVPGCWPDNDVVRNDLLDYAFEVEHFDMHLGRMLAELEKRGLLENTLVIVSSDNGMPFPRSKGNTGELPNHIPLAVMWPRGVAKPGRTVDDYISFVDIAPTLIEVAGLEWSATGMAPPTGRSLTEIFRSEKSGVVNPARDHVIVGRERNDIGRPHDEGYPVRGIIKGNFVYLQNFEPGRWPAGNPETGYLDCDGSPTKTFILDAHRKNPADIFWARCFGKRPSEEFYDMAHDPDCLNNLALAPQSSSIQSGLREQLLSELRAQADPRMNGQGAMFDKYVHSDPGHVGFYERFMAGEKMKTGWVNPTDFEKPVTPAPAAKP
jgi:N-sulfoglucosamine sulfohydrolase